MIPQLSFIIILIQGLEYSRRCPNRTTFQDINLIRIHISLHNYKSSLGDSYSVTHFRILQSIIHQCAKRDQVLSKIWDKLPIQFPDHTIVYRDLHFVTALYPAYLIITHPDCVIPLIKGVELVSIVRHVIGCSSKHQQN